MAKKRLRSANLLSQPAFTLIELIVTLSLVAILIAFLLPSLRSVRRQSRALKCQINLRSVAFEFQAFLTPSIPMDRGNDDADRRLGSNRVWLETFQETQYRVDEFWDRPDSSFQGTVEQLGVMACPEVAGEIQLRSGETCRNGAVTPAPSVSYALNLRLDRAEVKNGDVWMTRQAPLNENILNRTLIPLIWDIDGRVADQRLITPHFSAPPGEAAAPYGSGDVWFPNLARHRTLQVAFTSGEVLTTKDPLKESSWAWTFNP